MKNYKLLLAGCLAMASSPAFAVPLTGGLVTPEVIFGSGNVNGSFTGDSMQDVEVGLRAKLRFDQNGNPQNVFNYDGVRTYTFKSTEGVAPAGLALWNFEYSINVDPDGGVVDEFDDLDDLNYLLSVDLDPSVGTSFLSVDPVNVAFSDNAIGTNATLNGQGTVATTEAEYQSLISVNNVAQNSLNLGFLPPIPGFDPQAAGTYTIGLDAFFGTTLLASTSIDVVYEIIPVNVVPLPAGFPLLLAGLGAMGLLHRRRHS